MSDIAAARVFSHREEKGVGRRRRRFHVVVWDRWDGEYRFPPLKGGWEEGRGGNDKKDLQKRINFKRGGRSRRIGVYLGREGLGHGGKPP